MKVNYIRSDGIYRKIMEAPAEKKNDIYRYELMMPFKGKWDCYSVPMKAATPNGYDVIMASGMLGHIAPSKVDYSQKENIEKISSDQLWRSCEQSIKNSLDCFTKNGIELPIQEYLFTILLANAESPYISLNEGYCGDGGIPGYIFSWLVPNEYTLEHLPVALAHETNHNVRFQFIRWKNDITLGEMMVSEGLAENFATFLYGEDADEAITGTQVTKREDFQRLINDCMNGDVDMIITKSIAALDAKRAKLVDMRLEEIIDKDTYEQKYFDLSSQIEQLQKRRESLQESAETESTMKKRIAEFRRTLEENEVLDTFDRYVFESIVEKVIVGGYDEDGNKDPSMLTFIYKTGFKNSLDGTNFKPPRKNSKAAKQSAGLCSHTTDEAKSMCSYHSNDTRGDGGAAAKRSRVGRLEIQVLLPSCSICRRGRAVPQQTEIKLERRPLP